jgi:hypothetical protein
MPRKNMIKLTVPKMPTSGHKNSDVLCVPLITQQLAAWAGVGLVN